MNKNSAMYIVPFENLNIVRYNNGEYKLIEEYKKFNIYIGKRYLGGNKYKTCYIAFKWDVYIGSFSKLKGLKNEIDLFCK